MIFKAECSKKDAMAMIYGEGGNLMKLNTGVRLTEILGCLELTSLGRCKSVNIMYKDAFIELGGLDCENYQYLDKPIHDFMFRLQRLEVILFSLQYIVALLHGSRRDR